MTFYNAWDYDFLWGTHDGPYDWAKIGRVTDMGHAEYAANGSDKKEPNKCPFEDVEEIYEFDPVREYGLPSHKELVNFYNDWYEQTLAKFPEQVITGGYYKTVVSGAIQTFGWDMLLLAAADQEKFAKVLERFGNYTAHYIAAQAESAIEVFIQHDDMVWTEGPFMSPDFYRNAIFPLYKKIWEPIKKKNKKVLFCSDGKYDMFMEDIAECGADGFIFEPVNDFDWIVQRFGKTHVIIGSKSDCRTLAFGKWEDVKREIDETLAVAKKCPGFFYAVGNHMPANISDEMCDLFINYLKAN